jgi:hypothetical protein
MSKIELATIVVSDDEPCVGLYELDYQSPGSRGFHRYQILLVIRDDRQAEAWIDLGLTSNFKADQIRIPGGIRNDITGRFDIVHTVGELRDIADTIRGNPPFCKRELVGNRARGILDTTMQTGTCFRIS